MEDETLDRGRRHAFGAGAAAIGGLLAGAPKAAEAANSLLPFLAIKQAQAVGDGVTDDTAAFARFDAAGGGWIMPYAAGGTRFYIAGTWAPRHHVIIGPGVVLKLGARANVTLADVVILDKGRQCFDTSSGGTLKVEHANRMSPFCFGAKGDGVTDDTAAFAHFDAAGGGIVAPFSSAGTNFFLNGAWTPGHRVTIEPSAILKLGSHASVTIGDLMLADDYTKAFNTGLGGTLTIAKVNRLTPYHFGAAGNGTDDDSAACAAAMKAVPANGEMRFPEGTFAIGANLPQTRTGVTIRGERAKIVKKSGAKSIYVFTAATGNRFIGLNINGGETAPFTGNTASFGIYNNLASPASDVEVAHCVFNDIWNAIRCDGARNWNIHDNSGSTFFQFVFGAHSTSAPIARLRIAGNNFSNTDDAGLAIDPVQGNTGAASFIEVSNNILQDTNLGAGPKADGYAIDLGEAPTVGAVTDVLVHGNLVRQITPSRGPAAQRGAISISYITRGSVRNNICVGLGGTAGSAPYCYGIVAPGAVNSAIADNEVCNFIADGINVWGTTGVDVLDNLIINCGSTNVYAGISLNSADSGVSTIGCRVKGNRVIVLSDYTNASTAAGIYLASTQSGSARCSGIEIDDNTVEGIVGTAIVVRGGGNGEECLLDRVCNNRIVKPGKVAINLTRTIGGLVQGNKIYDAPVGIFGSNNTGLQVLGNHIRGDSGMTTYYVEISGTNTRCSLIGNVFEETGSRAPYVYFAGATILRNQGYVTENSGTASIATSAASVTVKHGLAVTPAAGQISVTPNGNITPATHFWVSGIDPTSFTINLNEAPTSRVDFGWSVRLP